MVLRRPGGVNARLRAPARRQRPHPVPRAAARFIQIAALSQTGTDPSTDGDDR
jgi:hypothetical protein